MKAWKHHIAEHFLNDSIPADKNGAGKGGTVFTDWDKMVEYLKKDGRNWYAAEINVEKDELLFEFGNGYMATILVNKSSLDGFVPLKLN